MHSSAAIKLKQSSFETVSFSGGDLEKVTGLYERNTIRGFPSIAIDHAMIMKRYFNIEAGRRAAPRFGQKLDVIVSSPTMSFRTTSANISATGVLLNEALPHDFMGGALDIVIILQYANVKRFMIFKGNAVGGPIRSPRVAFTAHALNSLQTLMDALSSS